MVFLPFRILNKQKKKETLFVSWKETSQEIKLYNIIKAWFSLPLCSVVSFKTITTREICNNFTSLLQGRSNFYDLRSESSINKIKKISIRAYTLILHMFSMHFSSSRSQEIHKTLVSSGGFYYALAAYRWFHDHCALGSVW